MYSLTCAAMGHADCTYVAKGETQEEVFNKLKEQAMIDHPEDAEKMMNATPEQMQARMEMAKSLMTQE